MQHLIILGSGPGGYQTAAYAAHEGMEVTIIERANLGGTCLNEGCIPTKCFVHDAERQRILHPAITEPIAGDDWTAILQRKNAVVDQLRQGVGTQLSAPGITLIHGEARFKDSHTIEVKKLPDGEANGPTIADASAQGETILLTFGPDADTAVIIATGSSTKLIPVPGIDSPAVVTSTELLDIESLPKRLCIIGAGVIGMEFASAFKAFGVDVTVVEFLKECLPMLDADIAKRLRKQMERHGVKFFMQSGVKAIEAGKVIFEQKGKQMEVEADKILVATGRKPNTDNLNLDYAGIAYDRKGITTDDNLQTSLPGIYAIGDCNGRIMLAHAAEFQGRKVVNHLLGRADNIHLDIVPSAIFTEPEAASVGKSEQQLKAESADFTVHKAFYRANGKALAMEATEGMVKVMVDNQTDQILGCHLYGANADFLAQEMAVLMTESIPFGRLHDIIHIHPTLSEILLDL